MGNISILEKEGENKMYNSATWQGVNSLINITEAQYVAKILCEHPAINTVLVFGSVARENEGEDLDLILVCNDEEIVEDFLYYTRSLYEEGGDIYFHTKDTRREIARAALGGGINYLLEKISRFVHPNDLDIFIFPADWRQRLDELQNILPHFDPNFMQNIAKDARGLWIKR